MLLFEEEHLAILDKEDRSTRKNFGYKVIQSAEYSYSKAPRWKSGGALAIAVGVLAIPLFFFKGKKHWLTIQGGEDFAVLHLDKKNYKAIIAALETKTGVNVETVEETK